MATSASAVGRRRSYLHPFPARMAPEIAVSTLKTSVPGSTVLDPMAGSGTVLRLSVEQGLNAIGRDVDPLAVVIAGAWVTPLASSALLDAGRAVLTEARRNKGLPASVEQDDETHAFVKFWFASRQQEELGSLALAIEKMPYLVRNHLWVAFSRLIVTKDKAASLARDTSHSRPHRVALENDFEVLASFERSVNEVAKRLKPEAIQGRAQVELGDARLLTNIVDQSIDCIVSSPPYLNAIDYLRGHRLSLVWMGWTISSLRSIRSGSVGSEQAPKNYDIPQSLRDEIESSSWYADLEPKTKRMVVRYAFDLSHVVSEANRVLVPGGSAVYVIGNSCLRGTYIPNSDLLGRACKEHGLSLVQAIPREIPEGSRYLPLGKAKLGNSLKQRMKTELVMEFRKD